MFAAVGKRMLVRLTCLAAALLSPSSIVGCCHSSPLPGLKVLLEVKRKVLGHAACGEGQSDVCACLWRAASPLQHGSAGGCLGWMGTVLGSGNSYSAERRHKGGKCLA